MAAPLHELFRVCAETAARVNSDLHSGTFASDEILNELARSQSICLAAMHARLRQKASGLGLTHNFDSRSPSQSFISDFNDMEQCMRYAVKCCQECRTAEQMRQLIPILRCFQSHAPNNSVLMPLFLKMGGLVAVLVWAKQTATQLKLSPNGHSMAVLVGVLQTISKFNVLPKDTVPNGSCKLLLDIMECRLPSISMCVAAVLRCWMKCTEHAEKNASGTRDSSAASAILKRFSPSTSVAASLPVSPRPGAHFGNAAVLPQSRSADSSAVLSLKLVAELCEDEAKGNDIVQRRKRPCKDSRLHAPSERPATSAGCGGALTPPPYLHTSSMSNIRPAPGSLITSPQLDFLPSSSQSSSTFFANHAPPAFDACATVQALESLADMLQHDSSSMFTGSDYTPRHMLANCHHNTHTAMEHVTELCTPFPIQDNDFFLSDDQFCADEVSMSSEAINRAFIEALQQFSQRDELSGLHSLCARFRS